MSDSTITPCPFCGIYGPARSAGELSEAVSCARMAWNNRVPVPELVGTHPVTLYFGSGSDREEFIALVKHAKPGLVSRKL